MVAIALVLFTLAEYHSPELAGLVTFASIFPGIAISPIAGVLLDRHGRIRLMILDYVVAATALVVVAGLSSAHALPAWLLVLIAVVMSLTSIFSSVGLRTLFPLIVPRHLWERANALDSNGYVVATIFGPPIAASLVAFGGGPAALFVIGLVYGLTALSMVGVHDPLTEVTATGTLLSDARAGLVYVWRNRTLRGLGVSVSVLNLTGGMTTIVVPLLVLHQLGANEALVGVMFAISGVSGMVSALVFGRIDTRGREWVMLVLPPFGYGAAIALVLPVALAGPAGGARRPRPGPRARSHRRLPVAGRPGQRPARHRPVHGSPATHRPGLARARVRHLDGLQLRRLPDRRGHHRRHRRELAGRRRDAGDRRLRGIRDPRRGAHPGPRSGHGTHDLTPVGHRSRH